MGPTHAKLSEHIGPHVPSRLASGQPPICWENLYQPCSKASLGATNGPLVASWKNSRGCDFVLCGLVLHVGMEGKGKREEMSQTLWCHPPCMSQQPFSRKGQRVSRVVFYRQSPVLTVRLCHQNIKASKYKSFDRHY